MPDEQPLYDELAFYTTAHPDPGFIHQNVVDAFAAQNADQSTKPMKIVFALAGLYLCLEKGFTGKQAQLAHMKMARWRKPWPTFPLPEARGDIRVADVLAAEPSEARDAMIRKWCQAVWDSWAHAHDEIRAICQRELGVNPD